MEDMRAAILRGIGENDLTSLVELFEHLEEALGRMLEDGQVSVSGENEDLRLTERGTALLEHLNLGRGQ